MTNRRAIPRPAFTLIELLIVLVVMAVLASVAAPKYSSSLANYRVLLAARRLAADLGAAQATARATSTAQTIVVTQATSTYTITGLTRLDSRAGLYSVTLADSPYYTTMTGATLPTAAVAGQIKFDGYGNPNTSATVTLSSGGRTRTVSLDAVSGAVTVQ